MAEQNVRRKETRGGWEEEIFFCLKRILMFKVVSEPGPNRERETFRPEPGKASRTWSSNTSAWKWKSNLNAPQTNSSHLKINSPLVAEIFKSSGQRQCLNTFELWPLFSRAKTCFYSTVGTKQASDIWIFLSCTLNIENINHQIHYSQIRNVYTAKTPKLTKFYGLILVQMSEFSWNKTS